MPNIFYISDTHFGHTNILSFDKRPFPNVEVMDAELVRRWNDRVAAQDTVYILGDFSWYTMERSVEIAKSLNGNKFLIKGNHDRCNDGRFKRCFSNVVEYAEIDDESRNVILCHYPILFYKNDWNTTVWMLHGHTHITPEQAYVDKWVAELHGNYKEIPNPVGQIINVGCMMPYMNYTPRTLDEIVAARKK